MQKLNFLSLIAGVCSYTVVMAQDPGAAAGSTGTVTGTYRGAPVTYTTVRAKDGWVWLQQNLGSAKVASSATDAPAYGDLFQWGRWDDGHQMRNPENVVDGMPAPNNPAGLNPGGDNPFYKGGGITWYNDGTVNDTWTAATPAAATATNGCDPCRQILGGSWQLPSLADWQAALNAEGVSNITSGFASNLRLTAAGARNELLGTLGDEGVIGIYWSSTRESGSAPQAMYINLYTSNLADYNYRGIGMPLRCMKKTLPTSIKERKTGMLFELYPNPATDIAVLDLGSPVPGPVSVTIQDILGQTVAVASETTGKGSILVHLPALSDGMYLVQVTNGTRQGRQRLLVQH